MVHPLQTKEWAEFRKEWGNEILTTEFGIITLHKIPFTNFKIGIFEKGPKPTKEMLNQLKELGKEKNIIFIKLEPNVEKDDSTINLLSKSGLIGGKTLFTPTTFWIDLRKSEEELLASFSSKTRYNIRLAQKHGVNVRIDNSDKAFEKYLELTEETNKRQGFYSHTPRYHKLMWKHLKGNIANLLTATYKEEIITTWILFTHDNFLYYPYGASTDKYKEVMANNLMMWEAIKFGKKQGLTTFDLWGREEGKGFTKFKEGYNPKVVEFVGSWDLVINKPIYTIYRVVEKIRWILLRLKAKL
ncbi:MAG TPA: peptidoglycan bridge formation glycyltransferase FemA/FemB family protein [Patescibacteria group bacterium]|nr:peptidoglycan bridge formation glycyltransferase FemA/FemB family protein [Patescibacteria group bacterium]